MKTKGFAVLCMVFFLALVFTAMFFGATHTEAQTVNIKVFHPDPPTSFQRPLLEEWAKLVESKTGGKVKATVYSIGTLTEPCVSYDALVKGIVDVLLAPEGFFPQQFPLNPYIAQFIRGVKTGEAATNIRYDIYNAFPAVRDEYKDVHLLWLGAHPPASVHTTFKVNSLKDFEGKQIRAAGAQMPWIKALGAVPVSMPMTDVFMALQKGIIKGTATSNQPLVDFRFAEVTDYSYVANFYTGAFFAAMNLKIYKSLPPDIQTAIDSLNAWGRKTMIDYWVKAEIKGEEFAKQKGHTFITPTKQDLDELYKRLDGVQETWAAEMEAKGKPGKAISKELSKLLKKYRGK
jgi:TRAP-type C4-dicarboxylate transport system substrate-binding protein